MTGYQIPHFGLTRQHNNLREEILHETDEVMTTGKWIDGHMTHQFEEWLKLKTNSMYACVTHSGTQALEIIAKYYKFITPAVVESAVWVPNMTYPATLNAFINVGWNDIRIADVDLNGLMKIPEDSSDGDFLCLVGLYGAPPPHFHPSTYHNKIVDGAQHWLIPNVFKGLGMAISFDPTKNLPSTGNGGAIVTDSLQLYDFALSYTRHGKHREHNISGSNSKMSELECAHLLVRSKYIDQWQERRKQIRLYWISRFKNLPIRCLSEPFEEHADQKFVIETYERTELNDYLNKLCIETRIHYPYTLSELPIARSIKKPDAISVGSMLTRGVLSLPIYPELTDAEVEYIASSIEKFYDK